MSKVDLTLSCQCGSVRGEVTGVKPRNVSRAVCYCAYCQGYQHFLKQQDKVLDELNGTDAFNISPRSVRLTQGQELISCVRMSRKGALRFYASCCNTPLFNTMPNLSMPFLGMNPNCVIELGKVENRDAILGPISARVFGEKSEYRHLPKSSPVWVYWMLVRLLALVGFWLVRGDAKHSPARKSDGQPLAQPHAVKLKDVLPDRH